MRHVINALLRIARVKLVDDAGPIQRLQIDEGDLGSFGGRRIIDKVPHFLQFGFASSPPLDSEVMLAAPAGDRTQTIALGSNHQPSRIKNLQPGDSCQYDVRGQIVKMTDAGLIIDCAGLAMSIRNFSLLTITGPVRMNADLTVEGDIISDDGSSTVSVGALHRAYNAHKHAGVASGSDTSGTTDHTV